VAAEPPKRRRTDIIMLSDDTRRLQDSIAEKDRQIEALAAIGRTITSTLDLAAISRSVYSQLRQIIPEEKMRTFYLAVTNYEKRTHDVLLAYEDGVEDPPSFIPFGEVGLTNWAVKNEQDLFLLDGTEAWHKQSGVEVIGAQAKSLILTLIKRENRVLGVISIQSYHEYNAYNEDHRRLMRIIADQAAVAIDNARLFRELRESAISRHLVGELIRDFSRQLEDAQVALYETGGRFASRLSGTVGEHLEAFRQQGLGRIAMEMVDPMSRRIIFAGRDLFSSYEPGPVPQDHFAAGFLATTTSKLLGMPMDCEETECRATGAYVCQFVVYPVDAAHPVDFSPLTRNES
jgi:predicted hydrocarbon binding protein